MNNLLRHNLGQPMNNRVARPNTNQAYAARMAGNAVALLAMVHAEIAPLLTAKRKADALLERNTEEQYGREKQGYSCLIGDKYQGEDYTLGQQTEPDLACENEPRFACIVESVKLSENK